MIRPGFTFVEVLLALVILTMTTFNLSKIQMRALFRIVDDRNEIIQTFQTKKCLYQMFTKPADKEFTKKIVFEDTKLTVNTAQRPVHEKSSLGFLNNQLAVIEAQGVWDGRSGQNIARLASFVYSPQEEKRA